VRTAGSAFQHLAWDTLRRVRAGTATTYAQLAGQLGRPGASSVVGLVNGANPVAIVVPCHRLILANGSLTRYGSGLARKDWLLRDERAAVCGVPARIRDAGTATAYQ